MNNTIKVSNYDAGITVSYREGYKLALAEAALIQEEGLTPLKVHKAVYYFSRINVPNGLLGEGIGTKLLDTLLKEIKERDGALICDISPYGQLGYEELRQWYLRHNFKEYYIPELCGVQLWYNA